MDNVLPYILAFAALTMAVVFGLRSWLLAQRERRNRRLRRSGSHRSSGHFSHRSSRRSSRRFRHRSSSRDFYRGDRRSDYPRGNSSQQGDSRGSLNPPSGTDNPPTPGN